MDSDDDIPHLIEHTEPLKARVPLTVICGFLGAGKSTLLKRILTERHGYRIAVIMNEFGDTADIEAKTINVSSENDPTAENSEEVLELANGCLCCSIKDSGAAAIEKLMERKGAFDHILLETTGLADPGPIAAMFWKNEEYGMGLGNDIALDGVICVVDAVFGLKQMQEDHAVDGIGESVRQIAGSDVIILNKVDLVDESTVVCVENAIRHINSAARIHRTIRGELDLKHIMGISAYAAPPQLNEDVKQLIHGHGDEEHNHDHFDPKHTHDAHQTHYEARGISSLQIVCPVLSRSQLDAVDEWIRAVLWENRLPGNTQSSELQVLRCKGLFSLEGGDQYVLQGVRNIYEMTKVMNEADLGVPDVGKLVLIGKGLDEGVRESFLKSIPTVQ
ncbi:CobW domain-containing protein [Dendrothele bispora CBS 962.96]|uniref:CobW domain-containing protein n=1 Tax=Dendrothele bispora (strain CBS 962.96) TaxID=1314807 RepID=A0A4S8MLU0_DENBC|nr:CobW domain-containing protein [Dendrothele bispora CBS 962.96]